MDRANGADGADGADGVDRVDEMGQRADGRADGCTGGRELRAGK